MSALMPGVGMNAAQTIDGQHAKREEDALAQIGDAEDVGEFLEHRYLFALENPGPQLCFGVNSLS